MRGPMCVARDCVLVDSSEQCAVCPQLHLIALMRTLSWLQAAGCRTPGILVRGHWGWVEPQRVDKLRKWSTSLHVSELAPEAHGLPWGRHLHVTAGQRRVPASTPSAAAELARAAAVAALICVIARVAPC